MKYQVFITESSSVIVEADSKYDALVKFDEGEYEAGSEQYIGRVKLEAEPYTEPVVEE